MNSEAPRPASGGQALCAVVDVPDGGGKGLTVDGVDGPVDIFVVRKGMTVRAYINSCPHIGTPLDWVPDRFMDSSGGYIMCATHGALFEVADGICVAGPCAGARLRRLPVMVRDGVLTLADH